MSSLSASLSLPVLALSSLHLFVPLTVSLCCSSAALHQIEADSCHQTYFRHWHTHNLAHSSLFTLCLSPSSVIPLSCCLTPFECTCLTVCVCVCVCVRGLGLVSEAWPLQHRITGRQKQRGNRLLLPVSSCPSGDSRDWGGGFCPQVSASLSTYPSFISNKISGMVVPSCVCQSYCFWHCDSPEQCPFVSYPFPSKSKPPSACLSTFILAP